MKIGVIREGKTPPDSRVPLTPDQCARLLKERGLDLVVQSSPIRCYTDEEYRQADVPVVDSVDDCSVLLGVKEVPIDQLIANKTYFFFSHTIKAQPYNRDLLRAVLAKNIRLVDYEVLTNERDQRVIAFGHFAGMVGAYNGLWTWGQRTGDFELPRMHNCYDYSAAKLHLERTEWPPLKIVLTGTGRVAGGAVQVLEDAGIQRVTPEAFVESKNFDRAVYTQLDCQHYAQRKDGSPFELSHFFDHPDQYESRFAPFTQRADLFINGIYWDSTAPAFFTKEDMQRPDFVIRVIADVTCDIAPEASIPSTLRATTIADPLFGYDPVTATETKPHGANVIDMMTIDNLPNELPRDASEAFGRQFIDSVLEDLLASGTEGVVERGTMTRDGALTDRFAYLQDYVDGVEN